MKFTYPPESKPLDGYTIKRAIQRGGFGEVYYAISDGGKEVALKLLQGEVEEIRPWASTDASDVGIEASTPEWEKLLAPVPRPFYQSLFAAATHHEVALSGDPMESYSYMGALTRMLDVMRGHVEFH